MVMIISNLFEPGGEGGGGEIVKVKCHKDYHKQNASVEDHKYLLGITKSCYDPLRATATPLRPHFDPIVSHCEPLRATASHFDPTSTSLRATSIPLRATSTPLRATVTPL